MKTKLIRFILAILLIMQIVPILPANALPPDVIMPTEFATEDIGILDYSVSPTNILLEKNGTGSFTIQVTDQGRAYAAVQYALRMPDSVVITSVQYSDPGITADLLPQKDSSGNTYFSTGVALSNRLSGSLRCTVNFSYTGRTGITITIFEVKQYFINGSIIETLVSNVSRDVFIIAAPACCTDCDLERCDDCLSGKCTGECGDDCCLPPPPVITWTGSEWDTNTVYAVNREDPHATFFPYADEVTAIKNHNYYPDESPYYQTLNGDWKFNHVMRPALRPMEGGENSFETVAFNDSGWDSIKVPGNWQVNWNADGTLKYDQPIYVNSSTPWARSGMNNGTVTYPAAPKNGFNPVGTYRREFTVDKSFKGRSVFLTLDGVESNCYIWINGFRVGYGEDSYSVKSYNISPWLNYDGKNVIAVQVFRWSSGSWFENQDMMRLSGIYRDIYLTAKPKVALYDVNVLTTPVVNDVYNGDWNLNIKALLRDLGAGEYVKTNAKLYAKLYDDTDTIVGNVAFGDPEYTVRKNMLNNDFTGADLSCNMTVATPELWSAEHPNLYKLVLTLRNGAEILETTCIRVGFRQVKTVNLTSTTGDARLLLNGTRLIFWGTNLHESNPDTGKATDMEFIRREYELMKQYNINSIRMSHYPHAPLFYDLADEYGIYIMDEANMENHGLTNPSGTTHQAGLIDRQNNMIERDFNYPSVVVWSTGNEVSLATAVNTAILNFVGEKDASRPRHAQYSDGSTTSTAPELHSGLYGPAQSTSQSSSGGWWQNVCNNRRPSVVAEYAHAMGNSNGNLDSFVEIFDLMPKAIGGFIWEWADHGLWTPVPGKPNEKYLAFDGDWDSVRSDGNFCMDGMVTADRKPYPQMVEVKYSYRQLTATLKDSNTFTINNKFLFSNANEFDMIWELRKNGEVVQSGKGVYNVAQAPAGIVPSVIVPNPPANVTAANYQGKTMTSMDFPVPFKAPENVKPGDEYFFNVYFALKEDTLWADAGFIISDSQMPVDFGAYATIKAPYNTGEFEITNNASEVNVSGDDFSVSINKSNGVISEYKFKNRDMLTTGPAPNFWRAPTDNEYPRTSTDYGSFGVWKTIGSGRTTTSVTVEETDFYAVISVSGSFPSTRPGTYTTKYTVYPNGEINVDYTFIFGNITGNNRYLQEIGSMMTVKSGFENLTWFGRGPGESYTDRKWGNFVGLWDSTVTNQVFPYAMTQEMGNKVETRWLALTDDDGFGMVIKGGNLVEFNALHYTPETLGAKRYQHPYEISPMNDICLRINLTSVGVGGNDSWGRIPEDKYRPIAGNNTFNYNYSILPVEEFDANKAMAYGKTEYDMDLTISAVTFEAGPGGKIVLGESKTYLVGSVIGIEAAAFEGYRFVGWSCTNGELGDIGCTATTFAVPVGGAVVKAEFERIPITMIRIDAFPSIAVSRGNTYTFDLILNEGAIADRILWSVNNPQLAKVTNDGTVTILNRTGTVVLTATDPDSGLNYSIILRIT